MSYKVKFVRTSHSGLWWLAEFVDPEVPFMGTRKHRFNLNLEQVLARIEAGRKLGADVTEEMRAAAALIECGATIEEIHEQRVKLGFAAAS